MHGTQNSMIRQTVFVISLLSASLSAQGGAVPSASPNEVEAAGKPATVKTTPAKTTTAKAATAKAAKTKTSAASAKSRYRPDRFAGRAGTYYKLVWGVDSLGVKTVESGEIIRFSYRVLDPDKAKTLNDEKVDPSLIDPRAGVSLVVPSLEKVGKLRQSQPPEEGKAYWMAFSNKGRLVKRGDHVNVVIGNFHADGLVVD